jgi:hypothetical protein
MISVWEAADGAGAFESQRTRFSVSEAGRRTRRVNGAGIRGLAPEPEAMSGVEVNAIVAAGDHCAELATTVAVRACTVSDVALAR